MPEPAHARNKLLMPVDHRAMDSDARRSDGRKLYSLWGHCGHHSSRTSASPLALLNIPLKQGPIQARLVRGLGEFLVDSQQQLRLGDH